MRGTLVGVSARLNERSETGWAWVEVWEERTGWVGSG